MVWWLFVFLSRGKRLIGQIFLLETNLIKIQRRAVFLAAWALWFPSRCTNQNARLSKLAWYDSKWHLKKKKKKRRGPRSVQLVGLRESWYPLFIWPNIANRWNTLLPSAASSPMFCEVFNYVRNLCCEKVDRSDWVSFPGLSKHPVSPTSHTHILVFLLNVRPANNNCYI